MAQKRIFKKIEPAITAEGLPLMLTVDQVSAILRLRPQTIREQLKSGQIPGVRVGGGKERGGRWRIPRTVIEKMLSVKD